MLIVWHKAGGFARALVPLCGLAHGPGRWYKRTTLTSPPPETPRVAGIDGNAQIDTQEGESEAEQEEEDGDEGVGHGFALLMSLVWHGCRG